MKRIIVMAIAVTAVVCAQGASVKWNATSIKGPNGSAIGKTTGTYTAICTIYATNGDVVGSSSSTSSNAMSAMSGSVDGTATGTSYFAQLVISTADGKTLTSNKAAFTTDSAATYSINFTNGTGFSDATAQIDFTAWESGGGDVPEPNSAILMLLGMAGLALRRKIA